MSELRRRGQTRPPRQPDTLTASSSQDVGALAPTATAQPIHDLFVALADYGAVVSELAQALALSPERIARAEALERLEITAHLPIEQVAGWDVRQLTRWFAVLEHDLEIDLQLVGLDAQDTSNVTLRAGGEPQRVFQRFIEEAQHLAENQGDALDIELRLSIAKTRAVAQARAVLATRPEYPGSSDLLDASKTVVFYHAASLAKLLRFGALAEWEQRGLARKEGRNVIVLCDASGYLAGMALEILGAQQTSELHWLAFSRAAWRQFQERAEQTRHLHAEESNWAGAPQVLTPAYLQLAPRSSGLEGIANQLEETQAALAAAYLASTVTGDLNNELVLRFAGPRPASCHLAAQVATVEDKTHQGAVLAHLAAWTYSHASPDKLAIARECLAHELPAGVNVQLAEIEQAAAGALEAAKANFTLYLRGNTAHYFELRQQALAAVTTYVTNVRKSVSDLTGEVVDNLYRTAGLLVGVVIAALIQPGLAHTVQQIAAFLFTAYLLFIVYYLLRARRQRFDLEAADLQAHLAAMPELSANERHNLIEQASGANQHFEQYYRWSRLIYLALAALGALYFLLLLTPLAAHLPLAAPQPTVTPHLTR